MAESAEQVFERVFTLVGEGGRLLSPAIEGWDTFPWEGVTGVKAVHPPLPEERARSGAGGNGCWRCANPDVGVAWRNDRWLASVPERPTGLPLVMFLMSRGDGSEHLHVWFMARTAAAADARQLRGRVG